MAGASGALPPVDLGRAATTSSAARAGVDASGGRALSRPELNFDGIAFTGVFPPDPVGEIGPDHYVQMVNGFFSSDVRIFDKDGRFMITFLLEDLARSIPPEGDACEFGAGDPIVLYDELDDRWLLTEFSAAVNALCVYISDDDSPFGPYTLYVFPTEIFPDYPKYGVWNDTYLVSTNEFEAEDGGDPAEDEEAFPRPKVYALDKTAMLRGEPAEIVRFTIPELAGFAFQAVTPADHDGELAPPQGSPGVFIRHRDDEVHDPGSNDPDRDFLEVFELSVDFEAGDFALRGPQRIAIQEYDTFPCSLTGALDCIRQPRTKQRLDVIGEVVMWRVQYRNNGRRETLVGNFAVDVGDEQAGIRWFELRQGGSGIWRLFQEGTHAPDGDSRWIGSIAMDRAGDIALGYSVSSRTTFPSIRYAGRRASDRRGRLPQGEFSIIESSIAQTIIERWGDYSSLNLDPSDGCTFWYTNEYLEPVRIEGGGVTGIWQTRIATFRFDRCARDSSVEVAAED
jgi:hypothetical protein